MNTNLVHGIHGKFKQLQLLAWPMQESSKRNHKRVIWHGLKQKKTTVTTAVASSG